MEIKINIKRVCVLGILMVFLVSSMVVLADNNYKTTNSITNNMRQYKGNIPFAHHINNVPLKINTEKISVLKSSIMSKNDMMTLAMTNTSVYAGGTPQALNPTGFPATDLHQSPSMAVNSSGYYWVTYEAYITSASNWYPILARSTDTAGTNWNVSVIGIAGARQPGFSVVKNVTRGNDDYWWSFAQGSSKTEINIYNCTEKGIYSYAWYGGGFDLSSQLGAIETSESSIHSVWNSTCDALSLDCLFKTSAGVLESAILLNGNNGLNGWSISYFNPYTSASFSFTEMLCKCDLILNTQGSQYFEFIWGLTCLNTTTAGAPNWDTGVYYGMDSSNTYQYAYIFGGTQNDLNSVMVASGGSFYLFYQTDTSGTMAINVLYDGSWGSTWGNAPVVVSSGTSPEYMPIAAINPTTATSAHVQYVHDNQLYYRHSTNSGSTWGAETQVSDASAKVSVDWHGTTMALKADAPFHAWTDARNAASVPTITGAVPNKGMTNVPVAQPLIVNYSKAIVPSTFVFAIAPDPGSWTTTWGAADSEITLVHGTNFNPLTLYTCWVNASADTLGQSASSLPYKWTFVTAPPPVSVTITAPTSASVWPIGTTQNVVFNVSYGTAPYKYWLNYTADGGTTTVTIPNAQGIACTIGSNTFAWLITPPSTLLAEVKIAVMDSTNAVATYQTSFFQIKSGGGPVAPIVSVTGPSAGSVWYINDTYQVNWTIANGTAPYQVFVNYSTNGGTSYNTIAGPQSQAAIGAGNVNWPILATVTPSANCLVKVTAVGGGLGSGTSGTFTVKYHGSTPTTDTPPVISVKVPNGGENWTVGKVYNITWIALDDHTFPATPVNITLSRDNQVTWETIINSIPNSGKYAWTVTGTATSAKCIIKITAFDSKGQLTPDTSNATFTVYKSSSVTPPAAPQNLAAKAGDGYVQLTWDAVTGATSYNIYREGPSETTFTIINSASTNSYNDTSVTNGKTYTYHVTAVQNSLESQVSNDVTGAPKAKQNSGGGGGSSTNSNNMYLYIGIIIIIVVVIVIIAVVLTRKKKPEPQPAPQPYGQTPPGYYPQQQGQYPPQQGQPQGQPPMGGLPCPRCGQMNAPGVFACGYCGNPLH